MWDNMGPNITAKKIYWIIKFCIGQYNFADPFLAAQEGQFIPTSFPRDLHLACSKRSDGGERCEVKKARKSRGGLGREVRERL